MSVTVSSHKNLVGGALEDYTIVKHAWAKID